MIPGTDARQAIALAGQGQNVSEIARRLGHDRKTIRIYLNGHRAPGQPRPHAGSFAPFAAYVRQRAADDPHLRSTGLHREAAALGYAGSYSAFTRELRGHGITAACGTCRNWKPIAPAQAQGHRPGPLPSRTAPLGGETIASYLSRTAAASHLRPAPSPPASRPGSPPGPPPATTSPPPASRSPRTSLTWPRSPGPAKPPCGTRCPRSPAAGARPSALPSPAGAAPPGTGVPALSPSTSPLTSGPAGGTGPGSAAPSRSTSPPPRTSSPPAGTRPGSPASTASPCSCSPRPPPAKKQPADRPAGDALPRSPWPARAWIPGTRTRPRQRPTPRPSRWPPLSSAHHTPGRNNWQTMPTAPNGPTYLSQQQPHSCHLKRPAQVRWVDRADLSVTGQPTDGHQVPPTGGSGPDPEPSLMKQGPPELLLTFMAVTFSFVPETRRIRNPRFRILSRLTSTQNSPICAPIR